LLRYVNIKDDAQKLLFLVHLIASYIPGFAHPILYVYGPQGSAKTSLSRILRAILDPSVTEVLSLPRNDEELVQVLAHHAYVFFDNVSYVILNRVVPTLDSCSVTL
jgi:ABC-type transport system involved in cytochrome c biogenesis ATPase subunit